MKHEDLFALIPSLIRSCTWDRAYDSVKGGISTRVWNQSRLLFWGNGWSPVGSQLWDLLRGQHDN